MHACQRCYSRKTKCDRRLPQCSSCARSQSVCQYSSKRQDRHPQQDYAKLFEKRLRSLEHENQQLRRCLASQSPARIHQEPQRFEDITIAEGGDLGGVQARRNHESPGTPLSREFNCFDPQLEKAHSPARVSLQRTPGEESRYLGSSNGADFVGVVERVVESSPNSGGLFQRLTDQHSVLDATVAPVIQPTGSQHQQMVLVDQAIAMPLITAYFAHWHLIFPLLYRPAFMQIVERIYSDPEFYSNNPTCAFVFDMVLALGLVPSKRFEWSFCDTESHFSRASTRLDALSKLRDIRSLQALLLCCEYGIHASLRDTSSEIWHLLGKATCLCVELGLHRDSATKLPKCDTHLTGLMPPSVQVEMQRRCFWCYHNLERIVSITLGRPLALHEDDINVPLPSYLDDQSLDLHGVTPAVSMETQTESNSPFLQHIHLRKIQAKIHRLIYTSQSTPALSIQDKQVIRKGLFDELEAWLNKLPLLSLPSKNDPTAISSGFLHPSWYQALYHSACLLLYRPSSTFPAAPSLEADQDDNDVLQIVWQSSRNVLAKYLEVLRARRLNYSWVCLYTIFMAGLANVYSVGRCAQRRKQGIVAFIPPYLDVISDVRDCSNILTAICERWDDVRSSCEIFNRLSMSALKELAAIFFSPDGDSLVNKSWQKNTSTVTIDSPLCTHDSRQNLQGNIDDLLPYSMRAENSTQRQGLTQNRQMQDVSSFEKTPEMDDIIGFQELFQDMQDSIYDLNGSSSQSNEVMLGFSQGWFGR